MGGTLLLASTRGLYRSDDGGHGWRLVRRGALFGAKFATAKVGFLSRGERLLVTRDGAHTWHLVRSAGLRVGAILDATKWWLYDRTGVLRTRDGGRRWTRIRFAGGAFVPAYPVNSRVGFTADWANGFYRTLDGGRIWRYVYPPGQAHAAP